MFMKNDKRADFGIINFWWCDDHGAILTAFALQRFIDKEGFSSELLKCWRDYDETKRTGGISKAFEKQYLKVSTDIYRTYDDIFEKNHNLKLNNEYIGFITGSDQVFRPDYVPDSWYLTFVNGKGKIAVAASFGTDEFICSDERCDRIGKSLKTYDYLSVREDSGVKICSSKFNVKAFHLLDPVFLIDKCEYERIIQESELKKKDEYIFCYIRDVSLNSNKLVEEIKRQLNCDVVWCDETMPVEDFLFNVHNCKCMITDSYHGLCFSIIFNKDYLCIKNTTRGRARFDSLQRQLDLPDNNFISEGEQINRMKPINYSRINQKLSILSNEGRQWLREAIIETYKRYKGIDLKSESEGK